MTSHVPTPVDVGPALTALAEGRGAGVRVAILDSGIDWSTPALLDLQQADDLAFELDEGRVVALPVTAGERDLYGHGTAVAAIVHRMAPRATVGSYRVLDAQLSSRTATIEAAARAAIAAGYHILNCSFGCRGDPRFVMSFKGWIDAAYLAGVHVVSACNNYDFRRPEWPAYFPTVVAVNMGPDGLAGVQRVDRELVEFVAAGTQVSVPWRNGESRIVSGSSYAAPRVTGLLARLLSVYPDLHPLETKALLRRAALHTLGVKDAEEVPKGYPSP